MRNKLIMLMMMILLAITGKSYAQCLTNSLKINTGYDPVTNTVIAPTGGAGSADPHWTIAYLSADHMAICGCIAGSNAIVVPPLPYWWYTMTTANWITFFNHTAYASDWYRDYRAQFSRKFITCDSGTYALDLDISDDNYITDISVDGVSTGFTQTNLTTNFQGHVTHHATVHLSSCGVHTITIDVTQESVYFPADGNAFGLLIDGTVTAVSGVPSIVREDSTPCLSNSCIGLITGPSWVCQGGTITLSNTVAGTWSATGSVTINAATGTVTGGTPGTATVTFTSVAGCTASTVITVLGPPVISGDSVCLGGAITLTSSPPVGTWSSGAGTIGSTTGILTGAPAGTVVVTFAGSCATVTHVVTVMPLPVITGDSVCVGSSIALTSSPSAGTWSTGIGTIGSTTGVFSGAPAGTAVVTFTGSSCTATHIVTVMPLPVITGDSVCLGGTITLASSESVGTWSSGTGTINSSTGVLTGSAVGTVIVTFTGSACSATHIVTVLPLPVITGDSVCLGGTIMLTSSGGTGTWSSATGTINSTTGVLTGTAEGTVVVTFTGSSCTATHIVAVLPLPVITGNTPVCPGAAITLHSTSAGTWGSVDPDVLVNTATGVVTGMTPGTAVVTFTAATGCQATAIVTVLPLPVVTGDSVCLGGIITLSSSEPGTWSSSTGVINSTTGELTGTAVGTVEVTFTGACTATHIVTVMSLPVITGAGVEICPNAPVTLYGSPATGTWSGGNSSAYVTDMGAGTGEVTAIAAGTAILTYTDGAGCSSTVIVTVHCPCAALDEGLTTLTSIVDYKEGCTYTCTAATSPINGWSIAGYLWQTTSTAPVWHPSTAGTDVQTVSVSYSGTEVVTVTYYAVDSTGDTCTLVRTMSLDCERQPCFYEDGTNLVVTSSLDEAGNCIFTATATVSTSHTILGYEWSVIGGPSTAVHTAATSDSYTFTVPSGSSTTVSVIVHIVDPYFGSGTSPCCDANLSEDVSCGGCKCFDSTLTTITSSLLSPEECSAATTSAHSLILDTRAGDQSTNTGTGNPVDSSGTGCCYKVTVNAGLSQSCTIVSYDWYVDGIMTRVTSSAASDSRIISVPSSGTVTVIVIIHAIDADGRPCDITRTITLDCGCHCLNEATTVLTYTQLSAKDCLIASEDHEAHSHGLLPDDLSASETSAGGIGTHPLDLGCCYNVTIVAGLVPGCKIVSYQWDVNGAITIVPSSSTTDSRIISIPDGTSVAITVTITAIDANGKECTAVRTLKLKCGCDCFDKRKTRIEYIKLPSTECRYTSDAKDGCCYQVTVTSALMNRCKISSYIWNVNGVITTIYTSSLISVRNISVPAGGTVNITVIITAIDENGIPCTEVRTLTLTCGCACFNDAATTLNLSSISLPRPSGCRIIATANASVNDPCKVISYTWESSATSPFTIYTSSLSDSRPFTVPYMSSITVTVTISAVNADGETCTIVKVKDYACGGRSTGCCFDTSATNLTYIQSMDIYGNCNFYVTANEVVGRGCRFIGCIWELPTISTGITTTSTFPVVLPASGGTTITVTFIAINAAGDTCKLVRKLTLKCTTKYGRSAGGGSGQVPPGEQIIVFPNPTDNAVTVSSESIEINTIQVINVNGQKVGNYNYDHAKSATLSLDKLVPGTYMLRINNEISKVVVKDK